MFDEDSKMYKLFISHLDGEYEEYNLFLDKLEASHDFQWKDYANLGKTLTEELILQMELVDVVIILSGLYLKDSKNIQRQIDVAVKLKKPLVVVRPYGMENVPNNLEIIATEVVGWNTPCIVDSIKEAISGDID